MEYRKNEKGVALLLALGFAALLLVLIMGFATNALIERKVAANVGDKMEAKAIAKSAINRALSAINYQIAMQTTQKGNPYDKRVFRFDNIVSKNSEIEENDRLRQEDDDSLKDLKEYFFELDKDNKRYVFKYRDGIYLYEYPYNKTDYSFNSESDDTYVKYRRPQWQYVKNADGFLTGRFMYAVLPDMGRVYYEAGRNATAERTGQSLKDFHVNDIDGMSNGYYADTPLVMRAKKLIDNDKTITKDNLKAANLGAWRLFYLYGIESDSDITWTGSDGEDNNKRNYKYLSESNTYDSDMVYVFEMNRNVDDLFKEIAYLDEIESGVKTSKEKQISANLIEAFNPDVSADVTHDGNFDASTTYTGNRRTPYINEIEVRFKDLKTWFKVEEVPDSADANGTTKTKYTLNKCEVTFDFLVELYSPYNLTYSLTSADAIKAMQDSNVKVNFNINGTDYSKNFELGNYTSIGNSDSGYPYFVYTKTVSIDSFAPVVEKEVLTTDPPGIDIFANLSVESALVYTQDGKVVDCVKFFNNEFTNNVKSQTVSIPKLSHGDSVESSTDVKKIISFQVKDARCNLDGSAWSCLDTIASEEASNIGKQNDEGIEILPYFPDVAAATKDKVSLADLVYISRGEAEKTLNILGDDKKLLDQLTTLKKSDLPQLIDINTRSIYLWGGLLNNIKCADGSTDAVASADVINLAKAISVRLRNRTEVLKRRSDFVEDFNSAITAASMTMTDEQKNAVLGKIMALCKIEDYPEYFYMIVIAQGIKENQSDTSNKGKDDDSDIVTAEVRYLVKLHRDNANKIKILSIEELID